MAFHPFAVVRKHQKVLMALATVFCMGVFILQFGRGDIFERFLGGAGRGQGEKLVALYGKDLTSGDVRQILQGRQAANQLVSDAVQLAAFQAQKDVAAYNPDKPNEIDDRMKQMLGFIENPSALIQAALQQNGTLSEASIAGVIGQYVTELDAIVARLNSPNYPDKAKAPDQARMAKDLRLLFKQQYMQFTMRPGTFYFGGGVKTEDVLDFEIWKHQADKLGVVLTKADARRALAHEVGDRDLPKDPGGSWASDPALAVFFQQRPQMTEDQLATAVADEFRVEIAKTLVAGRPDGVPSLGTPDVTPDAISPYDFWNYFRDNRTTVRAAFLPLPVESFLDQVEGGPTPEELADIYKQGQSRVPDPNSPLPGFRQPQKVRVQYLTAHADSDYYKALMDHVQYDRVRRCFAVGLPATQLGVAPVAALGGALIHDPLAFDQSQPLVEDNAVSPETATRGADAAEAAALVGLASGAVAVPAAPAVVVQAAANGRLEEATRLNLTALRLEAFGAGSLAPLGGLAAQFVPPQAVEAAERQPAARRFWEDQRKRDLPQLVEADLKQFAKDLADAMKQARDEADKANAANPGSANPDEAANDRAAQFIQAQAAKRGWKIETADLEDRYAIQTNLTLQPLEAEFPRGSAAFSQKVFADKEPALYQAAAEPLSSLDQTTFMTYWLTENQKEEATPYGDAQAAVMRAWRLQKARTLALKKAEQIVQGAKAEAGRSDPGSVQQRDALAAYLEQYKVADKLDHLSSDVSAAALLASPQGPAALLGAAAVTRPARDAVFELAGIARLVVVPTPDVLLSGTPYKPYALPPDFLPNIADNPPADPYAPGTLVNRLLALDAPGQALVFTDKPAKTFYVAVLQQKVAPQFQGDHWDSEFRDAYADASRPLTRSMQTQGEPMWRGWFLPRHRAEFGQALMKQLRAEAGPVDEQGRLKLNETKQQGPANSPENDQGPPPVDNPFQ